MQKIILYGFLTISSLINAQAYKGKGDTKMQVGALIQDGGTGIAATTDFGLGENISVGLTASYMLNAEGISVLLVDYKPGFLDRADIKARFNANLGNVLQLGENMDLYPGLNFGTRNFGTHLGFRYFFTDGFGVYSEFGVPLAKYNEKSTNLFNNYNNQFTFQIGASFNL